MFDVELEQMAKDYEISKIEAVLKPWASEAAAVFKHYSNVRAADTARGELALHVAAEEGVLNHDGGGMFLSLSEWLFFGHEIKVLNHTHRRGGSWNKGGNYMAAANAEDIFNASNKEYSDDPDNPDADMEGTEFIEGLVRMAVQMCPAKDAARSVQLLIEGHIMPNAGKLEKTGFTRLLQEPEMMAVMRKHTPKMRKLFAHFAQKENSTRKHVSAHCSVSFFVPLFKCSFSSSPPFTVSVHFHPFRRPPR